MARNKRNALSKGVAFILQRIFRGEYAIGSTIPSISRMAAKSAISYVSMWKAVAYLKKQGVLSGGPDKRTTVKAHVDDPDSIIPGKLYDDSRENATPAGSKKFERISAEIKKDWLTGSFDTAVRFPSLKELQNRYGASVPTLKKALLLLVKESILVQSRRGYKLAPKAGTRRFSKVALVGIESPTGAIVKTLHGRDIINSLEKECARAGIMLATITFTEEQGGIRFREAEGRAHSRLKSNDDTLGYIYLVNTSESINSELLISLSKTGKPVAILDEIGGWHIPAFVRNHRLFKIFRMTVSELPGLEIGRYLLSHGHKRIAYLSPFESSVWSQKRLHGLHTAFAEAGFPHAVEPVMSSWQAPAPPSASRFLSAVINEYSKKQSSFPRLFKPSIDEAFEGLRLTIGRFARGAAFMQNCLDTLLSEREITAWVGANDMIAIIALVYLNEKKIPVPKRIAVAGFDGSIEGVDYKLTTYAFDIEKLNSAILNFLLRPTSLQIFGRKLIIEIGGTIVQRRSTGVAAL